MLREIFEILQVCDRKKIWCCENRYFVEKVEYMGRSLVVIGGKIVGKIRPNFICYYVMVEKRHISEKL